MSQITSRNIGGSGILNLHWIRTDAAFTNILNMFGYIPYAGVLQTFKLPLLANVGDGFAIAASSPWKIQQDVNQSIIYGNTITTIGPAGSLSSTDVHDAVIVVCVEPNITWQVIPVGNLTPV